MSEIPWWVWALAGAAVLVSVAGRRRATMIVSAVLLGGATVAALLRAFLPPAPRDGSERLAAVGVLPPSGFAVALLLALGTAAAVLLAVWWPPRRLIVLGLRAGLGAAAAAALLLAGPLSAATADRIAASEVDSTTAESIGTIRRDATPTGPAPGARELWSDTAWRSAHLVPGSNLLVLAGRGVEVARGTPAPRCGTTTSRPTPGWRWTSAPGASPWSRPGRWCCSTWPPDAGSAGSRCPAGVTGNPSRSTTARR